MASFLPCVWVWSKQKLNFNGFAVGKYKIFCVLCNLKMIISSTPPNFVFSFSTYSARWQLLMSNHFWNKSSNAKDILFYFVSTVIAETMLWFCYSMCGGIFISVIIISCDFFTLTGVKQTFVFLTPLKVQQFMLLLHSNNITIWSHMWLSETTQNRNSSNVE